jgi:hypothetical protein
MDAKKSLPPLTFSLIEDQIRELPEGPVGMLDTPRWIMICNVIGVVALVVALMPSLLLQWMEASKWMSAMAQLGGLAFMLAFVPYLVRALLVLVREFRDYRRAFIEQLDHDVVQLRTIRQWLRSYPRSVLEEQLRYARFAQERLGAKLGLLIGGIDKLGLLPVCLSLYVVLRGWRELLALPSWLSILGIMAAILWIIGWLGASFRLRLQLHEALLVDSLNPIASVES